jgi:UPF0755 protein
VRRLLLFTALFLAATAFALRLELDRVVVPAGAPRTLIVAPGANARSIGDQLAAMGLVRHPVLFRALVRFRGVGARLRAGHYELEGPLTLDGVVSLLERGSDQRRAVTFPEGRNLEQMAEIAGERGLDPEAFLAVARDPSLIADLDPEATDLEGYLFPDTYDIASTEDAPRVLVASMVAHFRNVLRQLPEPGASGLSIRELVTLASIVEMETALGSERPRIAAVFLNRLERRMPLQTDPTVIHALRLAGRWDGNIRKRDLEIASPYNTYRYPGLPPGPIASPGRAALEAVLDPAPVEDLYFVSRNDGSHHFSTTLREHERAVDRYQRRRRSAPPEGG